MKNIILTEEQIKRYDEELASDTWKKYYNGRQWYIKDYTPPKK